MEPIVYFEYEAYITYAGSSTLSYLVFWSSESDAEIASWLMVEQLWHKVHTCSKTGMTNMLVPTSVTSTARMPNGTLACICREWDNNSYCFYTAMRNGSIIAQVGQGDSIHSTNYFTWSELDSGIQAELWNNALDRGTLDQLIRFVIEDKSEVLISRCLLVDRETIIQRSNYLGLIEAFYYGGVCLESKILDQACVEVEKLAGVRVQWRRNWGDRSWNAI